MKLRTLLRRLARHLLAILALALFGTLVTAALVRRAPGYGVDERELDPRWSAESLKALRQVRAHDEGMAAFYLRFLAGAVHGDLGTSESFGRPVAELLRERLPVTRDSVSLGLTIAWATALGAALLGFVFRGWMYEAASSAVSGLILSLPFAVVALVFVGLRGPVFLAIGLVISPRLFRYIRNLVARSYEQPHVLAARARGLGETRILLRHVLPVVAGPLLALLGVSFTMAFGAAIPMEALCDSPGLGQLAWHAALNRDLPLILVVTLAVALMTLAANSLADLASRAFATEAP
jgi:peptide/nickel transport system permease protein